MTPMANHSYLKFNKIHTFVISYREVIKDVDLEHKNSLYQKAADRGRDLAIEMMLKEFKGCGQSVTYVRSRLRG